MTPDHPLNHFRLPGLRLVGCEYPAHAHNDALTRAKLAVLADLGIARIIDLTNEHDRLAPYTQHIPSVHTADGPWMPTIERFPIDDVQVPGSVHGFDRLVDHVAREVAAGTPVAVHCWGGVGRTGMVLAAVLVRFGWPVAEALAEVNRQWRRTPKVTRPLHLNRTAPETHDQREFVTQWADSYARHAPALRPHTGLSARQARGCLLGGALGDSLGAVVEFMDLHEIRREFGDDGVTRPQPAYGVACPITDDTQMTLFTAEGLLRLASGEPDAYEADIDRLIGGAYRRWLYTQLGHSVPPHDEALRPPRGALLDEPALSNRRAPGTTCITAMQANVAGREAGAMARNTSKGCGTVMRVAPVGLVADSIAHAYDRAKRASALTHGHPTGIIAGGAFAAVINGVRDGLSLKDAIARTRELVASEPHGAETLRAMDAAVALARELDRAPTAEDVHTLGLGWVAEEALSIALFGALVHTDDYEAAVRLGANLVSGDSDSTASMTGQLVGLMLGPEALPAGWLADLELRDLITDVADDLAVGSWPGAAWRERWPNR